MFNKLLAVAATLLLATGISVMAGAAPASAHTRTYGANCDNLWFQATADETRSGNSTPNAREIVDSKSSTVPVADTAKCQLPTDSLVTPLMSSTATTCKASGSYTLGELAPGTIVWTVNGVVSPVGTYKVTSPQTVTLTATPKNAADGLDPIWSAPQTLTFEEAYRGCQLTTLAFTGSTRTLGFAAIVALLILGGVGFWIVRRRLSASA